MATAADLRALKHLLPPPPSVLNPEGHLQLTFVELNGDVFPTSHRCLPLAQPRLHQLSPHVGKTAYHRLSTFHSLPCEVCPETAQGGKHVKTSHQYHVPRIFYRNGGYPFVRFGPAALDYGQGRTFLPGGCKILMPHH